MPLINGWISKFAVIWVVEIDRLILVAEELDQ